MVAREGKYSKDLLTPAPTVTDFKDSVVCPESVVGVMNFVLIQVQRIYCKNTHPSEFSPYKSSENVL